MLASTAHDLLPHLENTPPSVINTDVNPVQSGTLNCKTGKKLVEERPLLKRTKDCCKLTFEFPFVDYQDKGLHLHFFPSSPTLAEITYCINLYAFNMNRYHAFLYMFGIIRNVSV